MAPHNQVRYTLNSCRGCSLQYWSPLTVDTSIYEDTGFTAYQDYHAGRRPFPRWAEPLMAQVPPSTLRSLDIGCGDGAVMERLQSKGVDVVGIDLDPQSIAVALRRCGPGSSVVSTLEGFIDSRPAGSPRFDLVTFFEVLEHQVDPRRFLGHVYQLVSPGGTVAGSVPARDRFLSSLDRIVDSGDLPPHHFLWFSPASLRSLLEGSGYKAVEVTRTGAIGLAETHCKVRTLIGKKVANLPAAVARLALAISIVVSAPMALVYWAGRRVRPSHLYFRCRA